MAEHGTTARAQKHHRDEGRGWDCPPCRAALTERDHLRNKALKILRDRHYSEWLRILTQLKDHHADERK